MLAVLVAVGVGAFLSVLSVVALVKILQIAEDLRYMRSCKDSNVQRSKPYRNLVIVCVVIGVMVALVMVYMIGASVPVPQNSGVVTKLF